MQPDALLATRRLLRHSDVAAGVLRRPLFAGAVQAMNRWPSARQRSFAPLMLVLTHHDVEEDPL